MAQIIIDFAGGLEDGGTAYLDTGAEDREEAALAEFIYSSLKDLEGTDQELVLAFPSPAVLKQAARERWGKKKTRARLPFHEYAVTGWLEDEKEVYVRATYAGTHKPKSD